MTTSHDLGLLRVVAQRIAGRQRSSAADVVRHMGAMQAQDYGGALASVALRMAAGKRGDVEAALDSGDIVRSWPIRGTLHFVPAEDLRWILSLTSERLLAGATSRQAALGFDAAQFGEAREIAVEVLGGGRRLRRSEFLVALARRGFDVDGPRGYHTIWHLAQDGVLCFGPTSGKEQCLLLVDEWINSRRLERDEALCELTARYFCGHGPATTKDFARWSGLRMFDVRAGLSLAEPRLARLTVDDIEYFLDAAVADSLTTFRKEASGVFLLPGFDEYLLGYADRSAVLPAEFAGRIVPGGNGMFKPTVISGGQVVGTWRTVGAGNARRIDATPFTAFSPDVLAAVRRQPGA